MGSIGGGSLLSSAAAAGADSLARTTLLALIQNRTPFDVVTKRQRFQNMVVQSLKMPRNKDTGYAVYFEIDLIQLRIVSPQFVNVQQLAEDIISSGSSNTNLGSQATNATSSQAQMSLGGSWYRQVYNGKSPNFFGGGG